MGRLKKIRELIAYNFDKMMDRGTFALILFLLAVTLIVSIIAGAVLVTVQTDWSGGSLIYSIWKSFLLTLDPGNQLAIEGNFELIAITAIMTFSGIAFITTLIGIINSGITNKYEKLRQGTSKVIEKNHAVVLGFNDNIYRIVSELIRANAEKKWYAKRPRIVILGDEDIGVMEQKIRDRIFKSTKKEEVVEETNTYGLDKKSKNTIKLIYRNGIPSNPDDLIKCSIETSKSVIINEYEDSEVIKIILAISKILENHCLNESDVFVVSSINDIDDKEVADIAGEWRPKRSGKDKFTEVLCFNDTISKIIAQTLFQPGLSDVYKELFSFSGNEIYMKGYKELFKKDLSNNRNTFSDVLNSIENAMVIGIRKKTETKAKLCLNMNENIVCGDEVIYIAKNRESATEWEPEVKGQSFIPGPIKEKIRRTPGGILIFGYNKYLEKILLEWNKYFDKKTTVKIFVKNEQDKTKVHFFHNDFENIDISVDVCDSCFKNSFDRIKEGKYEHILVLSDLECDIQKSDTETMALLMRLRKYKQNNNLTFNTTSQMLDIKNRDLAKSADVNDFVVSSDIISLMMTQISQNRNLTPIFEDLLNADGAEIYLKPASLYVELEKEYAIHDIVDNAKEREESPDIFIGYIRNNEVSQTRDFEIKINPSKTEKVNFHVGDMIIVLSENWN